LWFQVKENEQAIPPQRTGRTPEKKMRGQQQQTIWFVVNP
jgi:hypothetical protein